MGIDDEVVCDRDANELILLRRLDVRSLLLFVEEKFIGRIGIAAGCGCIIGAAGRNNDGMV